MDPLVLRGVLAAFLGTAVMTISSTSEMHLRGRPPSMTPGKAGNKLLGLFGVAPQRGERLSLLGTWVHWIYGTLWGFPFWALVDPDPAGLRLAVAGPVFFLLVWGTALAGLPLTGLTAPPWRWGAREVAIDGAHHAAYVAGTVAGWWLVGRAT